MQIKIMMERKHLDMVNEEQEYGDSISSDMYEKPLYPWVLFPWSCNCTRVVRLS